MKCKRVCGNCSFYATDENENGEVVEFWHDRNKPTGFCAIQPLFTERKQDAKPCADYVYDKEE